MRNTKSYNLLYYFAQPRGISSLEAVASERLDGVPKGKVNEVAAELSIIGIDE